MTRIEKFITILAESLRIAFLVCVAHWIQNQVITYINKPTIHQYELIYKKHALNDWVNYFTCAPLEITCTQDKIKLKNNTNNIISTQFFLLHANKENSYDRLMEYTDQLKRPKMVDKKISTLEEKVTNAEKITWISLERKFNICAIKLNDLAIPVKLFDPNHKDYIIGWEIPITLAPNEERGFQYIDTIKTLESNPEFPMINWTLDFGIFTILCRPLFQYLFEFTKVIGDLNLSIIIILIIYYVSLFLFFYKKNMNILPGIITSFMYLLLFKLLSLSIQVENTPFLWFSNLIASDEKFLLSIFNYHFLSISSCFYLCAAIIEFLLYRSKTCLIFVFFSELRVLTPLMSIIIILNAFLKKIK